MISISKATKADLAAVLHLSQLYGFKMPIDETLFNPTDIALQARDESGALVGFVWMGLMAKGTLGYVDKVMVDPAYSGKKVVLPALYKELFTIALRRKVKQAFGIIRHDQFHDKAAKAALNMAWGADAVPYTYVLAQAAHMARELGV